MWKYKCFAGILSVTIFCLIKSVSSLNFLHQQINECNNAVCIRKCCPENTLVKRTKCIPTNLTFEFDVFLESEVVSNDSKSLESDLAIHVLYSRECGPNQERLKLRTDERFMVLTSGHLYLPKGKTIKKISYIDYCLDHFDTGGNETEFSGLICLGENKILHHNNYFVGMIISMPFLLATFLVYTLLPERNLHAKALMFYALSLFFGYLILVIIQLSKVNFPTEVCQALGFCVQFFFILSFFWMNVICADIYLTFSGHRGFSGGKRSAETKRFILYCLYACGMSFLITLITFLVNTFADNNATWHPNIGNGQCFFRGTWPELLYFYGPMGLILATNMIFFAITAYRIRQAKKDTSVLKKEDSKRHSYENDKQNFNLYLRLLLAMGINWTMELISWAVQAAVSEVPNYIWYVTDFCNAIYGLFIFLLFVFKKKIWKLLKKRYYTFIGKPQFGHFTSTTNQTRTSNYSTAETSLTDNHHHSIHREEIPLRTST